MELFLELALACLLAATLFHAVRLERALGVLKRDRAALEALVSTFNASTRQAESGIDRLRHAADGAGRQIARQIESSAKLKDDLTFLTERGERLADRLDELVRTARPMLPLEAPRQAAPDSGARPAASMPAHAAAEHEAEPRVRSQAERDLLRALRMAR